MHPKPCSCAKAVWAPKGGRAGHMLSAARSVSPSPRFSRPLPAAGLNLDQTGTLEEGLNKPLFIILARVRNCIFTV